MLEKVNMNNFRREKTKMYREIIRKEKEDSVFTFRE